ncbi:ROK family transcriptional regulator [Actinocatenispora sera]|uniref:ROK family transcriptional regulator n=1 Tax=Actinocatenispora sera TaxID=390989 RepID=UPI0014707228|nr:ROK family transcriptional regulator [Actinocatenispora sera]
MTRGRQEPPGTSGTTGPPLLRLINQGKVLAVLRAGGPLRVGELARLSGLSRPTVSHVIDQLSEAGWVDYLDRAPDAQRQLGRPARVVRFRADAGYVLGIDIGPHQTAVLVADLDGRTVGSARRITSSAQDQHQLLAAVRSAVDTALSAAGIAHDAVLSVAVGSPGIIDRDAGTVVQAPGLPGWTTLDLKQQLRRFFRCPVLVDNDVNLAVLGERWRGVARDADTVVFVLWGERVGAGICIRGQLHRGKGDAAGEIGYLTVLGDDDGAQPDDEGRGPFEREVGASAILRLARTLAADPARASVLADRPDLDVPEVFAAAGDDPVAREVVDTIAVRLARGLAPLLLTLDPDVLVIGGGISRAGPRILDSVDQHLQRLVLTPTPLRLSALGGDAVVTGAIRYALDDVQARLLPSADATDPAAGIRQP